MTYRTEERVHGSNVHKKENLLQVQERFMRPESPDVPNRVYLKFLKVADHRFSL
jgi:hypothetical protein